MTAKTFEFITWPCSDKYADEPKILQPAFRGLLGPERVKGLNKYVTKSWLHFVWLVRLTHVPTVSSMASTKRKRSVTAAYVSFISLPLCPDGYPFSLNRLGLTPGPPELHCR